MTFKITIAYDGSDFVGWQRQASGTSIQGLLEEALRELDQRDVTVIGAGRTDAGVHAFGQVASFALNRAMDAESVARALNARLPPAVRVLAAEEAVEAFHARYGATRKTYQYRIWHADVMDPFERAYAWHLPGALDLDAMAAAAALIPGRRDFAAFQGAGSTVTSTEREVFSSLVLRPVRYAQGRPLVVYEVAGNGFLRHMVRNIVGSLVEVGRGRRPVDWMTAVIEGRRREQAGPTAPPHGLALVAVEYGVPLLATGR